MRLACGAEGVEVHGTVWLIRQYAEKSIADKNALCNALEKLVQQDRRTPIKLVNELRDVFGCNKNFL
jgi:predicted nucleic acid-binding protein